MIVAMKRLLIKPSYPQKYATLILIICVAAGTLLAGSLLDSIHRSKESGVLQRCGRVTSAHGPQLQNCLAEKIVTGYPVRTAITYKITRPPTDRPAVSRVLKVSYRDSSNPLLEAANYLLAGGIIVVLAGVSMLRAERAAKRRQAKLAAQQSTKPTVVKKTKKKPTPKTKPKATTTKAKTKPKAKK